MSTPIAITCPDPEASVGAIRGGLIGLLFLGDVIQTSLSTEEERRCFALEGAQA